MLSIVIPTYQERENIESLLSRLNLVRQQLDEPMELIIVDGQSRDGTAGLARRLLKDWVLAQVLECHPSKGLAGAVCLGLSKARGDLFGVMDADLSHPPEILPDLVRALRSGRALAVASRYVPGASVRQWPLRRQILSRAANWLARPLVPVADATSGYFACPTELARAFVLKAQGFKILLELLVASGVRDVQEVPYNFIDRKHGLSKLKGRVLLLYASQLVRLYATHFLRSIPFPRSRRLAVSALAPVSTTVQSRAALSAVILTKNEETRIERCLKSIGWADEIIVVDGESTDRTVEICRSYGAKVISHLFSGDFGQERNIGNDAATKDWILQLDADDAVSAPLREQIEKILREGSCFDAYKFRRKNWFLGHPMRFGGWYHYYPHLFRKGRARFEGRVHHLLRCDGPMGVLEAALEHRPFSSLEQFVSRHNRYTAIEAQEMLEQQGKLPADQVRYQISRRPLKLFWKLYVKKQGWREGWYGLIFSLLYAWVHFLKWAKYWEACEASEVCVEKPTAAGPVAATQSQRRATLSVVMMTKNEESRLAACLDQVVGWADEIVVIDDQSTDQTVEIAKRYTDKVFCHASEDNHDRQWNRGSQAALSEWILHIDADEVVTPALKRSIDETLQDPSTYDAFEIMRKNFFLGRAMRFGGWYHRHLVLFRRKRARCVGKGIHVQLQVDGAVGFIRAEIEHYPCTSLTQFVERQNRYTSVEVGIRFEKEGPVSGSVLVYQLLWRPVKLFWKSYVKNHGRKEGWHGLVFALLHAYLHMIFWAKYWEKMAGFHPSTAAVADRREVAEFA